MSKTDDRDSFAAGVLAPGRRLLAGDPQVAAACRPPAPSSPWSAAARRSSSPRRMRRAARGRRPRAHRRLHRFRVPSRAATYPFVLAICALGHDQRGRGAPARARPPTNRLDCDHRRRRLAGCGAPRDAPLVLDFADEESVVQTRFATTTLALLRAALGARRGRGRAPDAERALPTPLPLDPGASSRSPFWARAGRSASPTRRR